MPVAHYKMDRFIVEMFRQVDIDLSDSGRDAALYIGLMQASVGCNPRTMKRLFNAYLLLTKISAFVEVSSYLNDPENGRWYKQMLFAILCCQHAYEDLYVFMIRSHGDFVGSDLFLQMTDPVNYVPKKELFPSDGSDESEETEYHDNEALAAAFKNIDKETIRRMAAFMKLFAQAVDRDGNGSLDQTELEGFVKLLNFTTITSAGNEDIAEAESPASRHRMITRSIMNMVLSDVTGPIRSMNRANWLHKIYQSRDDNNDGWKNYYAVAGADLQIGNRGTVDYACMLQSNIDNDSAVVWCQVKRRRNFRKHDFIAYCTDHPLITKCGFTMYDKDTIMLGKEIPIEGVISENSSDQRQMADAITAVILEQLEYLC